MALGKLASGLKCLQVLGVVSSHAMNTRRHRVKIRRTKPGIWLKFLKHRSVAPEVMSRAASKCNNAVMHRKYIYALSGSYSVITGPARGLFTVILVSSQIPIPFCCRTKQSSNAVICYFYT